MLKQMALLAIVCVACQACSSLRVEDSDGNSVGVPFFEPEPYLLGELVDGQLAYSIIYLPNPGRKYYVRPEYRLGSIEWNVKLADGWRLETINGKVDPQFDEAIKAMAGLLTAAAPMLEAGGEGKEAPPRLYKIDLSSSPPGLIRVAPPEGEEP